jgi:hypothetical protein
MLRMNRPTGVTVIAALYFLGAAFCVCLAIVFVVGGGLASHFLPPDTQIPRGVIAAVGGLGAIVMLIFGAISVVVAMGLLKLKEWARIVAIVFACIGLLFGALGLLRFSFFGLIRIAINGWILWYLLQPQVVAAFRSTTTVPPPIPAG